MVVISPTLTKLFSSIETMSDLIQPSKCACGMLLAAQLIVEGYSGDTNSMALDTNGMKTFEHASNILI